MGEITVYDGAKTIGGNKIFLQEKGKGVFLDFGLNFAKESKYFQEFIQSRSGRGLYDQLQFKLIPELKIYRKDLVTTDLTAIVRGFKELDVEAVLLSHAHMDHFGNIGVLNPKYPIIASPVSFGLLKGFADSSSLKVGSEVVFYSTKTPGKSVGTISGRGGSYALRNLISTEAISDSLDHFLRTNFKLAKLKSGFKAIDGEEVKTLVDNPTQFDIKAYDVDHSIYGATAYVITGESTVAYTGDFRLHGKHADKSKEFVKNATDASILIIEGTRTTRDEGGTTGVDETISEDDVYKNCLEKSKGAKGVIVANFPGRNIERLETFNKIANDVGRKLVIPARAAYVVKALERVDGVKRTDDIFYYIKLSATGSKWKTNFLDDPEEEVFKSVRPKDISAAPDKFILFCSFYEMPHLLDIKPVNGTYIYSSSEAFTEEDKLDFKRFNNWLKYFNFDVYGFSISDDVNEEPEFDKNFHASGHASKEDLRWVIETIDPEKIIPVHTKDTAWYEDNFSEKLVLLEDGNSFTF